MSKNIIVCETYKGHTDDRYLRIKENKTKELYFRSKMWMRDNGICGICNNPVDYDDMDVDHILPKSYGGKDLWDNLRVSHKECNRKRGNRI